MKPEKITMQIVKNLGNYEAVRLEATWLLDEDEELKQAFKNGRAILEQAFTASYSKKEVLTLSHPRFNGICRALHNGDTDINEIKEHFVVSSEAKDYFIKHDLI